VEGFGLVISDVPYNGPIQVGTVTEWFDRPVQFISMYEIGDYIYTFFTEDPDETEQQDDVYSRVSRLCKDDMGVPDTINAFSKPYRIFTSFLKARMTCVSGTGGAGAIPYHYDKLRDTFIVESKRSDGSVERNLYAIFNAPENGPEGSAVCVYSFDENDDSSDGPTLDSVFDGTYLEVTGANEFREVDNPNPFTCSTPRTAQEADKYHLMSGTVVQTSGHSLHLQLTGHTFQKILVATATDLAGVTHNIMYIASSTAGGLVLLKTIYDSALGQPRIASERALKLSEDSQEKSGNLPSVTRIQLLGNGSDLVEDAVFVGTTDALYRLPLANCERFSDDCCACVAARDPHCAFDSATSQCVVATRASPWLIQDMARGDIGVCSRPPGSGMTPPPTTDDPPTTPTGPVGEVSSLVVRATPTAVTPSVGGLKGQNVTENYLGTIMGTVFGFVGGVVFTILFLAFCYRNRDRFVWSKVIGSRRLTVQQQPLPGASNKDPAVPSGATNNKAEDYERNNSDMNPHSNATNVVHVNPISNLPYSKHHYGNKKRGSSDHPPPPYSPNKPTPLPSNGAVVTSLEMTDGEATPTKYLQSTPEHKKNRSPPMSQPQTPDEKMSKTPPMALALSTLPKSAPATPPAQTTPHKATPPQSSPLTPVQVPAHRHPYHHSQGQATPPHHAHYFSTLPSKKRHSSMSQSETTPTKRPSSAEAPAKLSFLRPASTQNLSSGAAAAAAAMVTSPTHRTYSVTTVTTPTKQRPVPHSPFSATPTRTGVPSSPFASSAGTPTSTCSGGSHGTPHFKFPPTRPPEGGSPYRRGEPARNPNVKATGMAVEATTNLEQARYGHNVAARVHTIDRKNKMQNGHAHRGRSSSVTGPLPDTTVIEIDGGFVGCTDC
jgi:hypothetical protein